MDKVNAFIDAWSQDDQGMKPIFISLYEALQQKTQATIEFHERPGITYSLRGMRKDRPNRPLFVMVDVIDDDPGQRWLSVCFYGDMIQDPDELGDLIPGGLLGEDGYCFDLSEPDERLGAYAAQRIAEAYVFSEQS